MKTGNTVSLRNKDYMTQQATVPGLGLLLSHD